MKISQILINHMVEPIGFALNNLRITFKVQSNHFLHMQKRLILTLGKETAFDSGFLPCQNNFFEPNIPLTPRSRYHVEIILKNETQMISSQTFFETGKMQEPFVAKWIANSDKNIANSLFMTTIQLQKAIKTARLYITALGLYETFINGRKVGNEFLAPGQTAYNKWIQIQTYDITDMLISGKNELLISTADGWFKGPYGFISGIDCIYGDRHKALAEYHIEYEDGNKDIFYTDENWKTTSGNITKSSIYYGEDRNDLLTIDSLESVEIIDENHSALTDRLSLPLVVKETLDVAEILHTPIGETVLDFGQNHAGLFRFYNREPKGTRLFFQVGEILQEGNFYRENLRSARSGFEYISDGIEKWVQPKFTYYGYRYLKVVGNTLPVIADDFKADVIYSDMQITGNITTQNPKVNRLFQNILWGQKSNFFDVPTDCPQRDERLGWSGDANVFSNTALFNMNATPFYRKYLRDLAIEQELNNGRAPMYAPSFGNKDGGGAIWGDATTFIPWNIYHATGDSSILKEHYSSMKDWVDWVTRETKTKNLWTGCFQFGDWLALDGENPAMPTGKTNEDFIASIYYYYSSHIISETAMLLGEVEDADKYRNLSENILNEIRNEFLTPNGRLAIDTQTAYALSLQFNIIPEKQINRIVENLVDRLFKDDNHLKTGFVGTPFINQVLSQYGHHKLATEIFLTEDYPGWLYAVNLGATTVWERWNSVLPDHSMNPEGMNSLNHYSIGAVMEWAYKYIVGIRNPKDGYREFEIAPEFDYRLNQVHAYFDSPYGNISVSYQLETDSLHTINISLEVPFGSTAHVVLPRSENQNVRINNQYRVGGIFDLTAGIYEISYIPTANYIERYSSDTPVFQIMQNSALVDKIDAVDPVLDFFRKDPSVLHGGLGKMSLTKLNSLLPFINVSKEHLEQIGSILTSTPIPPELDKALHYGTIKERNE